MRPELDPPTLSTEPYVSDIDDSTPSDIEELTPEDDLEIRKLLAAAKAVVEISLKIPRALTVDPGPLNAQETMEVQRDLDQLLFRLATAVMKANFPTELTEWVVIQFVILVYDFEMVFRTQPIPGDPPSDIPPYEVRLKPGAIPVTVGDPKMSETNLKYLRILTEKYLRVDWVEWIHNSRWSARPNVRPKLTADPPIRLTIDLMKHNTQIQPVQWALPRLDETSAATRGSKYFGSTDLHAGYWQVLLAVGLTREVFSYKTPDGVLSLKRLPQGSIDAVPYFHGHVA
jgi:hypothetical protein